MIRSETNTIQPPPLANGDHLTWEEFETRCEADPDIKRAELINGVVYMSPVSYISGQMEYLVLRWIGHYVDATPGCETLANTTFLMAGDAPQPDAFLRIREDYGGQSKVLGKYLTGAPELVAEVCLTTAAYDLNEKLSLYARAGVKEYITVLLHEREVLWHVHSGGGFSLLALPADRIYRSTVFPGLWLDVEALFGERFKDVLATLNAGMATEAYKQFAEALSRKSH